MANGVPRSSNGQHGRDRGLAPRHLFLLVGDFGVGFVARRTNRAELSLASSTNARTFQPSHQFGIGVGDLAQFDRDFDCLAILDLDLHL